MHGAVRVIALDNVQYELPLKYAYTFVFEGVHVNVRTLVTYCSFEMVPLGGVIVGLEVNDSVNVTVRLFAVDAAIFAEYARDVIAFGVTGTVTVYPAEIINMSLI